METTTHSLTNSLQTQLSAKKTSLVMGNRIQLSFSVVNTSEQLAQFCRYMTPFEGFCGNILQVRDVDGNIIPYAGVLKKRGKPGPADFYKLDPFSARSVEFDLQDVYPIRQAGTYRIQFKGKTSMNGLPDSNVLEIIVAE